MTSAQKLDLLHSCKLYGIVDTGYVASKKIEETTETLCQAGVRILQFRAKDFEQKDILPIAHKLRAICRKYGSLFVINDFPDIALTVEADILHIGQDDGSLKSVRAIVGPDMLIGRSTHSPNQAKSALNEGFNYIGFGPLFPTPTKKGRPGIGLKSIKYVSDKIGTKIPVFCIGGIKKSNLNQVLDAGAQRVVIVSDLLTAPCIKSRTSELLCMLDKTSS